jgi:hypothetical protein
MVPRAYVVSGFWVGVVVGVAGSVILWLWVRLARTAGALANRRGYPRLAGVAFGLLTGPLAIATFALLPSRRRVHHSV